VATDKISTDTTHRAIAELLVEIRVSSGKIHNRSLIFSHPFEGRVKIISHHARRIELELRSV